MITIYVIVKQRKKLMENLIGDNVTTERKREKGVEKSIYFANISCPDFEQFTIDGTTRKTSLPIILDTAFNMTNSNSIKRTNIIYSTMKGKIMLLLY